MVLRKIAVFAVVAALSLTTAFAVQAGEGKVVKLESAANVIVLEDGSMYRVVPDTVILVEEKPVKYDTLQPGAMVVIQSGEPVQFKDGQYIVVQPSASPASR